MGSFGDFGGLLIRTGEMTPDGLLNGESRWGYLVLCFMTPEMGPFIMA